MFGPQDPAQFWSQSHATFKLISILSVTIFIISLLFPAFAVIFIDIHYYTFYSFQIWRLFTSFLCELPNIMAILGVLFSLMWLRGILNDEEASSVYKLTQIILINVQIHIVLNVIALFLSIFFQAAKYLMGYGLFPIILIFQFRNSTVNPEAPRQFCCLPFMIKSKYFPWVLLALMGIFSQQQICFLACGIVGYVQEVMLGRMLIQLPYSFYVKFQGCLPDSVKSRSDFVSVDKVGQQLKGKCCGGQTGNSDNVSQSGFGNPFNRQQPQQQQQRHNNYQNNQQEQQQQEYPHAMSGHGTAIGGGSASSNNSFKNYWAHKQENSNDQPQEFQIQPVPVTQPPVQQQGPPNNSNNNGGKMQDNSFATLTNSTNSNHQNQNQIQGQGESSQNMIKQGQRKQQKSEDDLI